MAHTFRGGLHIPDHKELTREKPIRQIDGAPLYIFPLQQHIGAPLEAVVKPGDAVKIGDIIADSDAHMAVPVHSSVSGTVQKIAPALHPSGTKVTAVYIENDYKYEISERVQPKNPDSMGRRELLQTIRDAGIVGMGGAGFPTHVKLSPPEGKPITHVIVNGAECEPYLTSDHRRMLETPGEILDGLKIAMKILGLSEGSIGIEQNKPDAIRLLAEKAAAENGIHVVPLKTKYPQGAEKQLIKAITKKQVPSGGLPADVGVIVLNIDTVTQISRAFRTGMPLVTRIVTVSGDCINEPCNLEVRLGAPFSHVIDAAGGFSQEPKKLIMGGPMMGVAQFSLDTPVIKTTSALLAFHTLDDNYDLDSPCLRCGKCVEHCPMHLMPLYLSRYTLEENWEMAEKYNALDCIECGICSYLCPGLQSPLHNIRIAKQTILENRRKKK